MTKALSILFILFVRLYTDLVIFHQLPIRTEDRTSIDFLDNPVTSLEHIEKVGIVIRYSWFCLCVIDVGIENNIRSSSVQGHGILCSHQTENLFLFIPNICNYSNITFQSPVRGNVSYHGKINKTLSLLNAITA